MYSYAKLEKDTVFFMVKPTMGYGSFAIKICIPRTTDYREIEEYVNIWIRDNLQHIEEWEIVDASLLSSASNNYTEASFEKDSNGNPFSMYIDECFTSKEPVLMTVERYIGNKKYKLSLPNWGDYIIKEEKLCCSFTEEELEILSDAMLNLINSVSNAKTLIPDKECQIVISNNIKKYTKLNCKICSLMTNN